MGGGELLAPTIVNLIDRHSGHDALAHQGVDNVTRLQRTIAA